MVRLDMSEFSEPHSVSRLIGAPPGYVARQRRGGRVESGAGVDPKGPKRGHIYSGPLN